MKDLAKMSAEELRQLMSDAEKQLCATEKRERDAAKTAAEEAAKAHGFSLSDLVGSDPSSKRSTPGRSATPKYRHPEQAELTWSGRGRVPGWLIDAIGRDVKGMSASERIEAYELFRIG